VTVPRVEWELASGVYRDAPGLAHSDAKRLRRSPWHFKALEGPRDPELMKMPSPQMAVGTMVHVACLEPHRFDCCYAIGPDINKNTREWRAFAQQCADMGREPIAQLQRDQAFAIAQAARAVPDFAAVLAGARNEASLWWRCKDTGVLCKARPDVMHVYAPTSAHPKGFAILADLKTTEDASAEGFARSVADYSYHTQAHWYCDGVQEALGIPVLSHVRCMRSARRTTRGPAIPRTRAMSRCRPGT
jgi:exodeoxyribonuclease VIII